MTSYETTESDPTPVSDSRRAYAPVGEDRSAADIIEEHPEALFGAGLLGGFLLATIIKRLGS